MNRRRLFWPAFVGVVALISLALFGFLRSRYLADTGAGRSEGEDSFAMKRRDGGGTEPASSVAIIPQSDAERLAEYEAMLRLPAATLLERWLVAARTGGGDERARALLLDAFATVFAHTELVSNPRISQKLVGAMQDDRITVELRAELAYALGQTEAIPAYQALLQAVLVPGLDADLRLAVLESISSANGGRREDVAFPEDLGPVLESGLQAARSSGDTATATATALALARLGTSSGVRAAFELYFDEGYRRKDPAGATTLVETLTSEISNPSAIPFLSALLTTNPLAPGTAVEGWRAEMLEMAGAALIEIGTTESAQNALEWLREAPDESVPLVNAWFGSARALEVQATAQQFLTEETFQSEAVKVALEQALERSRGATGN